jgi:hypothetical protein
MIRTEAFVSDCACVKKSRLRSNPFPFARVPATRPSGFWSILMSRITWSRTASTSGSVPYGVSAIRSITRIAASTLSYSFPWIAAWMKTGTLTSFP